MASRKKRVRSEVLSVESSYSKKRRAQRQFQHNGELGSVPEHQQALLLRGIRQPYEITSEHLVPKIKQAGELLIRVAAIGLNPIDWKAPDYNFGIPILPYVAGRELAGTVIKTSTAKDARINEGDVVIVPSTDYRDQRKAAYQEYTVASVFNTIRLPLAISPYAGSILGVAFVSAALTLGICMGLDFGAIENGPDLLDMVHNMKPESLASDIRAECVNGISHHERAKRGDFLVIWGGSSTCAYVTKQIARLAGLRIISVVDSAKHGLRLSTNEVVRSDLIVDSHDPDRAVEIIRASSKNRARFGFDTQGKETARHLLRSLESPKQDIVTDPRDSKNFERTGYKPPTPPSTPLERAEGTRRSHLIGLTGLPKTDIPAGITLHSVPIKLFHEVPEIGEALSTWCERLLLDGLLIPPDVVDTVDGLASINGALDKMRRHDISGGRLVAVLKGASTSILKASNRT